MTLPEPEFSCLISVDKIPTAGLIKEVRPNEAENNRLAVRFDLLGLANLKANLTAQLVRSGQAVQVKGRLVADVIQKCGVTTEPVPDHIEHDIEILYTNESEEEGSQIFVAPTDVDIESLSNGVIDLGELVAQNLGVALNPYPRIPGAVFKSEVPDDVVVPLSPLAKLAELAKKSKDKS